MGDYVSVEWTNRAIYGRIHGEVTMPVRKMTVEDGKRVHTGEVLEKREKLGTPAKMILMLLARRADENGENIYPSVDRLSAESELDERSVQEQLSRLREAGLIEAYGQGEDGQTKYRLHLPPAPEGKDGHLPTPDQIRAAQPAAEWAQMQKTAPVTNVTRVRKTAPPGEEKRTPPDAENRTQITRNNNPKKKTESTPSLYRTETDRIGDALAELCVINPAIKGKQITADAKRYADAGYTAEHVKACGPEWYEHKRKRNPPNLLDVGDMIEQVRRQVDAEQARQERERKRREAEAAQRAAELRANIGKERIAYDFDGKKIVEVGTESGWVFLRYAPLSEDELREQEQRQAREQAREAERQRAAEQKAYWEAQTAKIRAQRREAEAAHHVVGEVARFDSEVYQELSAKCDDMVVDVPKYQNQNGKADMFRILKAVAAEGIGVVTRENVDDVLSRLKAQAQQADGYLLQP